MIYPKFPQRYLAAIVFCFILTLAALGAVFLIYLFNCANQSPLIFASSGINEFKSVAAKPPNYFYNDDGIQSQQQQQEQHQLHGQEQQKLLQQIVAATSEESSRFMQNDVDDGDLDVDDEGPQTAVLQQQTKLKQWQHVSEDAETTLLYQHSQTPEIFENFKQQHLADTADGSIEAAEDGEEDVADTEDNSSHMNGGDGDEKNYEQSKQQQMLSSNSNDNIDTIYIDDNERSSKGNNRQQQVSDAKQHTDDTNDDDGGNGNNSNNTEKLSTRREDFTRINKETRKYSNSYLNKAVSTTAIAMESSPSTRTNSKNNSKQGKIGNRKKQQQLQPKQFPTLEDKMKKKQQRLLRKLQRQNSPKRSDSNSGNSNIKNNKKQQHQQLLHFSTQKIKQQLNYKQFAAANYDIAYDDDDDNINRSSNKQRHDIEKIAAGSGSGDFSDDEIDDENDDDDDSDDDYDIDDETTNFIKRINLKMWHNMGDNKAQKKWKQQQHFNFNPLQLKQQQKQQQQHTEEQSSENSSSSSSNNKKSNGSNKLSQRYSRKHDIVSAMNSNNKNKQQQRPAHNNVGNILDNFYSFSSEIVSNLSVPQFYQDEIINLTAATSGAATATTTAPISTVRINQISSATNNNLGRSNTKQRLLLPLSTTNGSNEFNISRLDTGTGANTQAGVKLESKVAVATAVAAAATEGSVGNSNSSSGSNSNSPTSLLETRTRRIMGNVQKSEERSRQLLLCEEAGGGELCRMLFKGHLNE